MSGAGIVVFSYANWESRYPEFVGVNSGTAQLYFDEATLYLDNTSGSIVQDIGKRTVLLNMLTAHIAALYSGTTGSPASPLVGRISNASEGSVSVGTQMTLAEQAQWYAQTKYGLSYFQATAYLRTARYVPQFCGFGNFGAYGFGFGGPFGPRF